MIRRNFGVLATLAISILLLWNKGPSLRLAKRQSVAQPSHDLNFAPSPGLEYSSAFHEPYYPTHKNFSHYHFHHQSSHEFDKRARTLTYRDAVCRGQKLYGQIIDAWADRIPAGREYGPDDINNGWTKYPNLEKVPDNFVEPIKAIGRNTPGVGAREPTEAEANLIKLLQDRPFRNAAGEEKQPIPKSGVDYVVYEAYYIPLWNTIISIDALSPRHLVQSLNEYAPDEIDAQIPPLNRQSDVMWTVWKSISPTPNTLRYIARNGILNEDTRGIMGDIFAVHAPLKHAPCPWPGLTFKIDTEEAQALLATPNGLAAAYILKDRARELGNREVSVTIAAEGRYFGYRMLWDMAPLNGPTSGLSSGIGSTPSTAPSPTSSVKSSSSK